MPILPTGHANHHIVEHPLITHKLTLMRDSETSIDKFRRLMREVSLLLAYEVTRDFQLYEVDVETPLARTRARRLQGNRITLVSILRAGNGLLDGILDLIPSARVGHLGLYREPKTHLVVEYYCKLPDEIANTEVILIDPMLATGHTAVAALSRLREYECRSVRFMCLLAAPEGLAYCAEHMPDVSIFTAAVDERLDSRGYIIPGLGDAGDRLYGTK